ncbi:MAG: Macrolide export protein MacA [bacterium ADurb.Bin478]|nr:MAG: Macrolide export protein MacA [bacterium ADurb.Bin478]
MKDLLLWSCTAAALLCIACADQERAGVSGVGTLEAREVLVSSKSAGTVLRLPVREGDVVTAGQLVAVIDSEKVFLQKQQLLAGLEELRYTTVNAQRGVQLAQDQLDHVAKKFERIRSLWQDSSATLQQYEDIETAHKAAATQLANARTTLDALRAKKAQLDAQLLLVNSQLADGRIAAPIDGTVLETYIEQGEIVRPTGAVVKLADLQHMWIKIYLNENDLGRIRIGQKADLQIASRPDQLFPGQVTWISPKAEFTPKNVQTREARSDLVYAVKIAVENPDGVLKIGMPADVYLR